MTAHPLPRGRGRETWTWTWTIALLLSACGRCDRSAATVTDAVTAPVTAPADAAPPPPLWPELGDRPVLDPTFTAALPAFPDIPRFDVVGPVLTGDLAIVATSASGFVAVELSRGRVVWTRPAGHHVAPPLIVDGAAVLVGACAEPIASEPGDVLLGCLTRVDPARGADLSAAIIRSPRLPALDAFLAATGPQRLRHDGDGVLWQRGDAAVHVAIDTGRATPAAAVPDGAALTYDQRAWRWSLDDDALVATVDGRPAWRSPGRTAALIGVFGAEPPQVPVVRSIVGGQRDGRGAFTLIDRDGVAGSLGAAAHAFPGIQILASAFGPGGVAAIAVRLDTSLRRDYIAAFDGNGLLLWVWPLPEQPRADAVGVALDAERVVVFHDGDRLSVLPLSWEMPTPPPAAPAP